MTTIALSRTASDTSKASGIVTALVASFWEFCAGAREGQEIEARYRTYSRMSGPDLAARWHDPLRHLSRSPGGSPCLTEF